MKRLVFTFLLLSFFLSSIAQNKLRINLDSSGKTYIKANVRAQLWARYMETNPGTTIDGDAVDNVFDVSMRRLRMGITAQVTPKLYFYTLFGGNNLNQNAESSFKFTLLDMLAEYELAPQFSFGFGKLGWTGLSRWTVRSNKSLMAIDAPLFSLLTVNKNDKIGRQLGVYAKGQINKFDYVVVVANPYSYGVEATEGKVDFADHRQRTRTSGYVKYEFWDNESNKSPYSGGTGTYLAKKRLLNLGAGFMYQPKMTSQLVNGVEEFYDFKDWVVEVYMEKPLNAEKKNSITTYLGYFNTDFGPDYIRNVGANNYTSGGTSYNGAGNAFPMMGTGSTVFFQFGYLFPKDFLGVKKGQFQPNIAVQTSDFEGLDDQMTVVDLGVNYYITGHSNKLSLGYQNRPIFEEANNKITQTTRKGMIVLQYQIEIN